HHVARAIRRRCHRRWLGLPCIRCLRRRRWLGLLHLRCLLVGRGWRTAAAPIFLVLSASVAELAVIARGTSIDQRCCRQDHPQADHRDPVPEPDHLAIIPTRVICSNGGDRVEIIVRAWLHGPRGHRPLSLAFDTSASETHIVPEIIDDLGYSP